MGTLHDLFRALESNGYALLAECATKMTNLAASSLATVLRSVTTAGQELTAANALTQTVLHCRALQRVYLVLSMRQRSTARMERIRALCEDFVSKADAIKATVSGEPLPLSVHRVTALRDSTKVLVSAFKTLSSLAGEDVHVSVGGGGGGGGDTEDEEDMRCEDRALTPLAQDASASLDDVASQMKLAAMSALAMLPARRDILIKAARRDEAEELVGSLMRCAKAKNNQVLRSLMVSVSLNTVEFARAVEDDVEIEAQAALIDPAAVGHRTSALCGATMLFFGQKLSVLALLCQLK